MKQFNYNSAHHTKYIVFIKYSLIFYFCLYVTIYSNKIFTWVADKSRSIATTKEW